MSQLRPDSYVKLVYRPEAGVPATQEPTGGIDFQQLARNKQYTKKSLELSTDGQEGHIALPGVTDREIVHLIKASEKQTGWVNRGGWWNIFFGLPALFLGISRYLELRHTTEKILRAALAGQCDPKDLDKLLKIKGGDNQLAKFLALALTNNQPCLTKELAATIVGNWANGRELKTGLENHGYNKDVLQTLLPQAGKDSPGLANLRTTISQLPPPQQPRPLSSSYLPPLPGDNEREGEGNGPGPHTNLGDGRSTSSDSASSASSEKDAGEDHPPLIVVPGGEGAVPLTQTPPLSIVHNDQPSLPPLPAGEHLLGPDQHQPGEQSALTRDNEPPPLPVTGTGEPSAQPLPPPQPATQECQPPVLTPKTPPQTVGPSPFSLDTSARFGTTSQAFGQPLVAPGQNPFASISVGVPPPTPAPTKPTVPNEPPNKQEERPAMESVMSHTGPDVPSIQPLEMYLTRLLQQTGRQDVVIAELHERLGRLSFYGNTVQFLTYLALNAGPQAALDVIFALPIPQDLGQSMLPTPFARLAGQGLRELDQALPSICHNLALPQPGQKIEGHLDERAPTPRPGVPEALTTPPSSLRFYSQQFSAEDQQMLGQFVAEQAAPNHDRTTFGGQVYQQAIRDSVSLRLVDTDGHTIDVTKNRAVTVEENEPAVAPWTLPATPPGEYDCQLGNNQAGYVALLNAFTGNPAITLQISAFLDQATLAVIMTAKPSLLPGLAAKDQSNSYELQRRPNGEIVLTIRQRQHIHPAAEDRDLFNRERGPEGVETQFHSAALEKTVVIKFASGQQPQVENTSIKCARIDPKDPRILGTSFAASANPIRPEDSAVLVPPAEVQAEANPLAYLPPAPALVRAEVQPGQVPALPPDVAAILPHGNMATLLAALPPGITPAHIEHHRQHPLTAANFYRFLVNELQIASKVLAALPQPQRTSQPIAELERQLGLEINKYAPLLLENISKQDVMTPAERQRLLAEWAGLKGTIDPVVPNFSELFAEKKVEFLRTTSWPVVRNQLPLRDGQPPAAANVQTPAAVMGIYGPGIAGVSSLDTTSRHIPNLWVDDYQVTGKRIFHGYRHGTLTPFGHGIAQNSPAEKDAAVNRAKELLTAMLLDDPALLASARAGQPTALHVSSMSLMTPDKVRHTVGSNSSDERHMWQIQRDVLRELSDQPAVTLTLPGGQQVNVKVEALAFNFGINRGATALAQGLRWVPILGNVITGAMGWDMDIIRDNLHAVAGLRAAVDAYMATGGHPENEVRAITTLMGQIDRMQADGSYMVAGNDPVKMPARIMALSYLLGYKTAFNCKSGKDRTSIADVETKFLLTELELTGQIPEPGQELKSEQQFRYRELVRNSGNYDVQSCNTGGLMGYKLGMDSAYQARIGNDPAVLADLNGLSALAKE